MSDPSIVAETENEVIIPEMGVLIYRDLDPDQPQPYFKTQDVAMFFFQKSAAWLRWRQSKGYLIPPGEEDGIEPKRSLKGTGKGKGARQFSLLDVEKIAYSFHAHGIIDTVALIRSLQILRLAGQGYGVIA